MKLRRIGFTTWLLSLLLLLPLTAFAKPLVNISIKAEKTITVQEEGKEIKKVVEAEEILPGEVITYTLQVENIGNEVATNIVVSDQIPPGSTYIPGSASEDLVLTFSIDGGKNYKKPSLLTYEMTLPNGKKEKRTASPELYTHIQWHIPSLATGKTRSVHFQVNIQ